eukprot:TRINITY_DN5522_c0_g1_i2.p1 TRINITY_DN5522_c0_g1~~TRINITY_DN5522_c0_g1_i2.p1  ORF type:complete len:186 (-),score=47.39 TRINITY_DN5522_c0_g1_i2:49-606(-)
MSEVGEERETVLRICKKWLSEGTTRGGKQQHSPSLKSPSPLSSASSPPLNNNALPQEQSEISSDVSGQNNAPQTRPTSNKPPKYKAPSSNVIDLESQKCDIINHNLLVGDTVYALSVTHEDPTQWHEAVVEEVIYATNEAEGSASANHSDRFRLYFPHLNKREVVELNAINLELKRTAPNSCPKF